MNQYKSLLILAIGLNALTGCVENYDEKPKEEPHQSCSTQHYLFPTHLKASRSHLKDLQVETVSQVLSDQKSLIKYVSQRCTEAGVPLDIAFIPVLDSLYNPRHIHHNEAGLWQLNPVMAQNLSLPNNYWFDARKDIVASTEAVIAYMKFLHYKLEGDWTLALAAYHVGLQPVLDAMHHTQAQGITPSIENINLDSDALDFIHKLEGVIYLAEHIDIQSANTLHEVSLPGQIELEALSDLANISLDRLTYLNTGFKRPLTDPDGPHRILVDAEDYPSVIALTKDINKLRRVSKSNWSHHVVKKDENLSTIAHKFETSVSEIKRVNHLKSDMISVNQKLIIPDQTAQSRLPGVTQDNNHPGPKRVLHRVSPRDTLYQISAKYKVPIQAISHWNNLHNNAIHPDQILTIWQYSPTDTARFYTVKSNDSLTKIAKAHNVSVSELKKANHLKNDIIHPNERLLIPAKG